MAYGSQPIAAMASKVVADSSYVVLCLFCGICVAAYVGGVEKNTDGHSWLFDNTWFGKAFVNHFWSVGQMLMMKSLVCLFNDVAGW